MSGLEGSVVQVVVKATAVRLTAIVPPVAATTAGGRSVTAIGFRLRLSPSFPARSESDVKVRCASGHDRPQPPEASLNDSLSPLVRKWAPMAPMKI